MKVAYLTTCFGTQSHTFIRREIVALRALGLEIALLGVRRDGSAPEESHPLQAETHYLYPLNLFKTVNGNLKYFFRSPTKYLCGAWKAITEPEFSLKRRLKMLYHYFISVTAAQTLETLQCDHVHAHFMNVSSSIGMYAAYHSGIPYSITVHSAGTFKTPHILGIHQKLKQAQFLMMISEYNIRYFNEIQPCKEKAHLVRCGMDLENFKFKGAKNYTPNNPLRILAVGRFVEKKGFLYLVRAVGLLAHANIPFELTLIGSGPLEDQLKSEVDSLEINQQVHFTGQKTSQFVHQTMSQSDVVVVPSVTSQSGEMEGLPVVIMEAMATGIPVISTQHSGIPEIVINNQTGFLVPEKSPEAIAAALQKIVEKRCDMEALIDSAHNLVNQQFNIDAVAKMRLQLFSQHHGGA